jgi:hypothetical protein
VITALKGAGQCDITAMTPESLSTQATTAHYPFYLAPGKQIVTLKTMSLKSGTILKLPSITNFGELVSYSTTSKNCSIKANVLKANKKGACLVSATAPGSGTLWGATSQKQVIKIS